MLTKQAIDISFAQGLDTKTDPKRVQVGKFLEFENAVFQKGGLLQKRNGYAPLASLPDTTYSYLTTFSGNLTAVGQKIAALNAASSTWVPKGSIEPLSVATLPLIRNNLNQSSLLVLAGAPQNPPAIADAAEIVSPSIINDILLVSNTGL